MKFCSSFVILVVLATSVLAIESAENLASHFTSLPLREQTMDNLPEGREHEVFEAIIARQSVYLSTLLRLNHAPTVERVMTKFLAAEGKEPGLAGSMKASGSPYIIDELAPAFYKTNQLKSRVYSDGFIDYGQSAQAAEILGQIIARAPEFPQETKDWAKRHLTNPGPHLILSARTWWELNQAALLANQFDKVQVPTSYPTGVMPEQPTQQMAAPPAAIEPTPKPPAAVAPPPEPTPKPLKSSVAASMPTPAAEPKPAAKTNPVWWIVALIVFAGGAVFVASKKNPKA